MNLDIATAVLSEGVKTTLTLLHAAFFVSKTAVPHSVLKALSETLNIPIETVESSLSELIFTRGPISGSVRSGWKLDHSAVLFLLRESTELWRGFCHSISDFCTNFNGEDKEIISWISRTSLGLRLWSHDNQVAQDAFKSLLETKDELGDIKRLILTICALTSAPNDGSAPVSPPCLTEEQLNALKCLDRFIRIPSIKVDSIQSCSRSYLPSFPEVVLALPLMKVLAKARGDEIRPTYLQEVTDSSLESLLMVAGGVLAGDPPTASWSIPSSKEALLFGKGDATFAKPNWETTTGSPGFYKWKGLHGDDWLVVGGADSTCAVSVSRDSDGLTLASISLNSADDTWNVKELFEPWTELHFERLTDREVHRWVLRDGSLVVNAIQSTQCEVWHEGGGRDKYTNAKLTTFRFDPANPGLGWKKFHDIHHPDIWGWGIYESDDGPPDGSDDEDEDGSVIYYHAGYDDDECPEIALPSPRVATSWALSTTRMSPIDWSTTRYFALKGQGLIERSVAERLGPDFLDILTKHEEEKSKRKKFSDQDRNRWFYRGAENAENIRGAYGDGGGFGGGGGLFW